MGSDGFWNIFYCFYKLSARGVCFDKYGILTIDVAQRPIIKRLYKKIHWKYLPHVSRVVFFKSFDIAQVIYALLNRDYRDGMMMVLHCQRRPRVMPASGTEGFTDNRNPEYVKTGQM